MGSNDPTLDLRIPTVVVKSGITIPYQAIQSLLGGNLR